MSSDVTLENILRRCGDLGRYQLIHYIFLNFIAAASGINAFYYVFGVAEPLFRCRLPSNIWADDDRFESVNSTHKLLIDTWQSPTSICQLVSGSMCAEFIYDRSVFGRTFTEDGQYICRKAMKGTWLSTVYQIGPCFAIISGIVSDKIGRRKVIQVLTIAIFIIPVIIQLLLQVVPMSMNMKFALILFNQFVSSIDPFGIIFVLLMELASSSHRTLAGNSALISYTFGEIVVTLFAYLSRNWLTLKWLNSAYFALLMFYLYFVPESPYWLLSMKEFDKLEACLRKIAKTNGRADSEWLFHYEQLIQDHRVTILIIKPSKKKRIVSFAPKLCVCGLIGFVTMLLYIKISYGLALMNNTISPHLSIVIGAIVESIGYLSVNFVMITQLGRKYALIVYALFTSGCVIVTPFIQDHHPIATIAVSQLGKLAISGTVSVSWIYVPELFPTSMRGFSNAVLIFFGRFGAILAPIIDATLGNQYSKITFYVYAALTLVIILLVLFLPETRNRLFEDMEENSTTDPVTDDNKENNHENPTKTDVQ
ncbi:unnamed protein product [Rotaria magnacalcarata]|uniref:Major facilitator superfamily (MFS) profile domain-containing protein n=1 Tax=Rotaria magnacalcarata TaxID=392030 RepID=A0A819L0C2_9BILA|nr:unnamed protein product [Rotaria magnacalcarata]CAF3953227.1 unnamed protein product [Rotaria magnacalcarata]